MQRIVFLALSIALAFTNIFPLGTISQFPIVSAPLPQEETLTPSPTEPAATETPTPESTPTPEIFPTATEEATESVTPTLEVTEIPSPTPEVTIAADGLPTDLPETLMELKASPRFLRPGGKINLHWYLGVDTLASAGPQTNADGYTLRLQLPANVVPEEGEPFVVNADGMLESSVALDQANGMVKLAVLDQAVMGETAVIRVQLLKDGALLAERELSLVVAQHVSKANGGEVSGAKDKRAKVIFPPNALPEDADVVVMDLGWEDDPLTTSPSGKPWHPFKIEAYRANGEEITHFDQEITIEYAYDPEEYAGNESVLYLSYFDEEAQEWVALPGKVDMDGKRIIARSDHLTVLNPNFSTWQAAMLPGMAGWQVSTFTGAATYSVPLTLPPGPGGLQPSLELSYNSQVIDNASTTTQASWVGMGWSLDVPYIQRDNHGTWDNVADDLFYLYMNGVAGLIVKGNDGYWHTEDVNFVRIEQVGNPSSLTSTWKISLKDGTQYYFGEQDGTNRSIAYYPACESSTQALRIPWRWAVSRIVSPHGKSIVYRYALHEDWRESTACETNPTAAFWIYPDQIIYPNHAYRIVFNRGERKDIRYMWRTEISRSGRTAFMAWRLNSIDIEHDPNSDGNFTDAEKIRRYQFTYANDGVAGIDNTIIWPGYEWKNGYPSSSQNKTLTLIRLQELVWGENNQWNALPPYTFNYGTGVTSDGVNYPEGDAQHLRWVENGYGGRIEFTYSPWACNVSDDDNQGGVDCFYAWNSPDQNNPWKRIYGNFGDVEGDLGPTVGKYTYWYSSDEKVMAHPGAAYQLHMMVERRYGSGTVPLRVTVNNGAGGQRIALESTVTTNAGWTEYHVPYFLDGNANLTYAAVDTVCGTAENGGCHLFQFQHRYLPTFYRVTAMTTIDQQSGEARTTTYSYRSGMLNTSYIGTTNKDFMLRPPLTEFRGFATVTETAPDGHKTIYSYWQGEERDGLGNWIGRFLQGRLKEVRVTGADPNEVYQRTLYSYEVVRDVQGPLQEVLPFSRVPTYWWPADIALNWVRLTAEESYAHEGDGGAFVGTKTTYGYDPNGQGGTQWGNVIHQSEFEWVNNAWQAVRGTRTFFYPNVSTTKYLTGLPGIAQNFACAGTGCDFNSVPIGETQFIYDANASYGTPPTAGILSRQRVQAAWGQFIETQYGYDAWGNRISETRFKEYGDLSTFASGGAQATTFCYGGGLPAGCPSDGHATYLLWTRDAMNHPAVSYAYDLRTGNLLSETDMNGNITQADYDDYGRLVKVARPGDSLSLPTFRVEYIYQTPVWTSGPYGFSTRVTQRIDASTSAVLQKYYNGLGQLLQTRMAGAVVNGAPRDIIVDYAYDGMGRAWKQSMPRDVADTGGNMAAADLSIAVQTTYDALGRVLTVTQPDGATTSYDYSLSGNKLVTAITDANGNATTQKTDAFGRLLSVLPADYPNNPGVSYTYDTLDRLKTATYGNATTKITYDWAGRKIDMTDPDMGKWYYQYDAVGNLIRQTDARGQRTCLYYDALNRLLGKHYRGDDSCPTPPTYDVSYTYDAGTGNLGQRTGMEDASGSTTWTYDTRGRLTTETKNITGAGTFLTQWTYYANDAVKEMIYPGGNNGQAGEVVTYDYNSQALLKSMHSPEMNYVPEIVYDAAGRVDEMTLGESVNNGVLSPILEKDYGYYAWTTQSGRMQSSSVQSLISNINLQALTYTYDPNGNITQMIDARQSGSETLNYAYDSLNRLKTVTGAYEETARYDANGRITERQMPDASKPVLFSDNFSTKNTTAWNWSAYATAPYIPPDSHDSNPVAKSLGNTNVETTGLKRTTAIATQTTVQLRFKLSQVGTNAQFYFGLPPETTEPPCNPGELCEMSVPNDALEMEGISGGFGLTPIPPLTTYHNQAGLVEQNGTFYYFRMEGIHGQISSTPLLTNVQANEWYTLTLHRGGTALSGPLSITVTQESDPGKTATATQTVSDMDWQFRHTIQAGMVYLDDYKEISEDDSNVYVYGSKPHAVTGITSGGQTIRQYTYDLNGNMTQRIEGSDTYTFTYDAENRLATGAKNGVMLASYTYDGDGKRVKVQEGGFTTYYIGDYYEWREGPTTTAVKYYYAAGQRIAMRKAGTLTWLLGDHLGSATITATENGTLATEQTYTAWGQTRSGSVTTDRQYTGQISEPQLGIYFYNARYYDPYITQFTQPDSIIPDPYNPLDWNRYAYARSNPLKYADPDGHFPWLVIPILIFIATIPGDTGPYEVNLATAAVGDAALRFVDPIDWVYTGIDCLSGNCSSTDIYLGMLPFVNGGMDDAVDAARALQGVQSAGKWIQRSEHMSDAAREYQRFISGRADDLVYEIGGYTFDGFDASLGILKDAKDIPTNFIDAATNQFKPWVSGTTKWLSQAQNQVNAAGGQKIQWFFNSQAAREAMYNLFQKENPDLLNSIELIYKPME